MALSGTSRRLRRLQGLGGRVFLLALDHGLPAGPLPGIEDPAAAVRGLADAPLTGLIVNPGIARLVPLEPSRPLVVHLSAGTLLGAQPASKVLACTVQRAVALGADAVSAQVPLGGPFEPRVLSDAGHVVEAASRLGIPVLLMAYPPDTASDRGSPERIALAARVGAEIGADLVQVPHPGSADRMRAVVRGCPVPVLVAGGPRVSRPEAFLNFVRDAVEGGAAGLSVGRNLFQHPDPAGFARRIASVLLGAAPPVELAEA